MDEAHERSLNTDVLFGILRKVVLFSSFYSFVLLFIVLLFICPSIHQSVRSLAHERSLNTDVLLGILRKVILFQCPSTHSSFYSSVFIFIGLSIDLSLLSLAHERSLITDVLIGIL